jgi:SAM-dependent methyltransferase
MLVEMADLPHEAGRRVFGLDPAAYTAGRPGYPDQVFDLLETRCGLGGATTTLEIGPGGGQATVGLVERGASPLVAVEPNVALAKAVVDRFGDRVSVVVDTFENAHLDDARFDLVASATAFHWVERATGLAKVARVLRSDGWLALWWNAYHDPDETDALYEALEPILSPLPKFVDGAGTSSGMSWFEREARLADLRSTPGLDEPETETYRWRIELDASRARALFSTFSTILALPAPERASVLDAIVRVLENEFGGTFVRTCATVVYTARRL